MLLHSILKRAKRKGWIATNPAEDAERISVQRSGEFVALTPAEVIAVAGAATSEQSAAIFTVAAFTGLRLGELRALRWGDVDFTHSTVHVRRNLPLSGVERAPKSGKVRGVPLSDQAAAALNGLSKRDRWTGEDDYVFPSPLGGPFDDSKLRKEFHAACRAAGITRHVRLHDLRHTFGTLAVRGFPLSDVQAYMGHGAISPRR